MDAGTARRLLEGERERLLRMREAADEEGGSVMTPAEVDPRGSDAGAEMFDRELQESLSDLVDTALSDVDAAFGRLDASVYGRCETCGQPIADERLRALPAARRCASYRN